MYCVLFVVFLHFPSLVIRARYVFITWKAQQGSNKLSNDERGLVPQDNYMPIFLKPSHKIRILNVNIVYLYVCVIWFTTCSESFQKNLGSKIQ